MTSSFCKIINYCKFYNTILSRVYNLQEIVLIHVIFIKYKYQICVFLYMKKENLSIQTKTLKQLRSLGDLNSSEELVLLELIKHAMYCDRFWEDRFD